MRPTRQARRGKSRLAARLPALLLTLLLTFFLVGGLIPGELNSALKRALGLPFPLPPVAHVVASLCLVVSLSWWRPRGSLVGLMSLVLALGGAAELLQLAVPGREASWGDMGWNLLGILLGGLLVVGVMRRGS